MNRTSCVLILLTASLWIAPFQVHAQDAVVVARATMNSSAECAGAANPSPLERRIVEKAAQGIDPLRQFVWRTRMIYQLGLTETIGWLDQRRGLLAACARAQAPTEPIAAMR